MDVGDGEQDIALCEEPHARDDIALPEDDKWLQRVLQVQQPAVTNHLPQLLAFVIALH